MCAWAEAASICVTERNGMTIACVQGYTNGTDGIPISFKVLPMVPLVIPLVPMVMQMVPLAHPMVPLVPLVSQWYHWLPMVSLVKLPMEPLEEPRTEPYNERNVPFAKGRFTTK